MRFEGKNAIVVGGGRDIGAACSKVLAAGGAKVIVNYFGDEASANATVGEIEAAGGTAIAARADATDFAAMQDLVGVCTSQFGDHVDILVNVAGGLVARKTIAEMEPGFFDKVIRLNVHAAYNAVKAALPKMSAGSAIVNFASQAGRDGGGPGAIAYATGKGAVMTLTRGLAKELGPQNIRVNAVCPGLIGTTFHDTFSKDEVREKVAGMTPLRREGSSEEVADLVAYLASDAARFVTGANVDINGGLLFS